MSDIPKTIIYCAEIVNRYYNDKFDLKSSGLDPETYTEIIATINGAKEKYPDYTIDQLKTQQAIEVQSVLDKKVEKKSGTIEETR